MVAEDTTGMKTYDFTIWGSAAAWGPAIDMSTAG